MVYKEKMTHLANMTPDGFIARWISDRVPLSSLVKRLSLITGVMISFVFFRSPDIDTALLVFGSILTDHHLDPSFGFYLQSIGIIFLVV